MRLTSITGHCSTARLGAGGPPGTVLGTRGATDPVTSPCAASGHAARPPAVPGPLTRRTGPGRPARHRPSRPRRPRPRPGRDPL